MTLIDAHSLPADETIETEVCIVGSGPAGITLARELAGQNFRVCLLESGSTHLPTAATQSLSECQSVGDRFQVINAEIRNRQFGGNANLWKIRIGNNQKGVRYVPLDPIDFEQRDWLPYSGWPFDRTHLQPFYERAQAVCQIGPFAYEAEAWEDAQAPQLPFVGNRVTTGMFQFGPGTVFTRDYRDAIDQASNITTYLNANAVELETNETANTVTRVRVACLSGNRFWVAAKLVVLAVGGIEGAQLLLVSDQVQKTGLGNQNALVGRFFMDHPYLYGGLFIPNDPAIFNSTALYDLRRMNNVAIMGALKLTDEVLRREQLLNMTALLLPRHRRFRSKAIASLKTLVASRHHRLGAKAGLRHLGNVLMGVDDIAIAAYKVLTQQRPVSPTLNNGGWSYLPDKQRRYQLFEVFHQTEQTPHPDNRLVLSGETDHLGRRKVQLQWRWHDRDIQNIKRAQTIFAEEIARAGLGRFHIERDGDLPIVSNPGTAHHIGMTRMHSDPKQGVVDEHCQVHGVIASSSVFPTGGYANPTLTIIALAIRLADYVKKVMAHRVTMLLQN